MQSILKYKECAALDTIIPLEVAEALKPRTCIQVARFKSNRNTWSPGVSQNAQEVAERGLIIEEHDIAKLAKILAKHEDASIKPVEFDEHHQCYRIVEPAPSL